MSNHVTTAELLFKWGVSANACKILLNEPEIVDYLARERNRPPFPAAYTPQRIDVLFEDRIHISKSGGKYTKNLPWKGQNPHPSFIEIQFDGQCALFAVAGEAIVNRVANMAELDRKLGRLTAIA